MRVDHHGQVLCLTAFGQGEVAVYGQPIAALVTDRLHFRQVIFLQPRIYGGHLLGLARCRVIVEVFTGHAVVSLPYHELVLVVVLAIDPVFVALHLSAQLVIHRLGLRVQDLALALFPGPGDHGEHVPLAAIVQTVNVKIRVGIDLLHFFFTVDVPFHDGTFVAPVQVAAGVDVLIVEGEEQGVEAVLEASAHDLLERIFLRGAVKHHLVRAIRFRCNADGAGVVRYPVLKILLVVVKRLGRAGLDVHQIGVEHLRIALVHLQDHALFHPRYVVQVVHHAGPHAFFRRNGLHVLAVHAGAEDDHVLVAIDVAGIEQPVTFPEVAAHVTDGVVRHLHGVASRYGLDKDVHASVPRCAIAEVVAVRADAETGLFRVPEEVLHRDGGRWLKDRFFGLLFGSGAGTGQCDRCDSGKGKDGGFHSTKVEPNSSVAQVFHQWSIL